VGAGGIRDGGPPESSGRTAARKRVARGRWAQKRRRLAAPPRDPGRGPDQNLSVFRKIQFRAGDIANEPSEYFSSVTL
jgi:hypothetical protein